MAINWSKPIGWHSKYDVFLLGLIFGFQFGALVGFFGALALISK